MTERSFYIIIMYKYDTRYMRQCNDNGRQKKKKLKEGNKKGTKHAGVWQHLCVRVCMGVCVCALAVRTYVSKRVCILCVPAGTYECVYLCVYANLRACASATCACASARACVPR